MDAGKASFRRARMPELVVRAATDDYAVAILGGNCVHLHWRRELVVEAIHELAPAMAEVVQAASGQPFGFMTTGDLGCSSVSPPEQREALAELLKHHDSNIAGAAIVFEEQGFRATMVRSAITAISLLSSSRFPHKVFAAVPPAATWLAARPGVRVSAPTLLAAVDRLRGPGHARHRTITS